MSALDWVYVGVVAILGAAIVFAAIAKLLVWIRYSGNNAISTENGLSGEQAAVILLQKLDMQEVQVKKMNWFVAMLYGNHYNARKKTIYLRGNIFDKQSITAVGLATQKVGLAIQDRNGDKKFKVRSTLQPFIILAPILFVPLALVGLLIDLILFQNIGVISIVFVCFALLFYLAAFVSTLVTIPVEKKANKLAMEIIEQTNLLTDSEKVRIAKVYKAYLISYIADFIMTTLYLIEFILRILRKFTKRK